VELRDLVKKWGSLTKWFYIWHYTTNFRYCMHPMPNLHNIAADTRFFRDSGATQLHMQGCWPHAAFASLKQWLVAKTSWNPDADADALIATFCRAYYGAGAPFVLEIIADEERCLMARKKPRLSIFAFDEPQKFPDALLERTLARWRKALAAVEGDSWRTHHVRMGELATVATLMDREADSAKWVWATERPEAVPAPRADFAQLYAWMEEARKEGLRTALEFHFAEIQNRSASYVKKWERVLAFSRPGQGSASGRANAQDFEIQFGSGGMEFGKLVDDPGSAGGKAVRIGTARNGPVAKLAFANVAFDPDALYRLRVRLRVAKAENGRGEAFYASLDKDFKPVLEAYADVQSVADGYAWYDLGVTKLSENMTFGLGCGRYAKGGGRTATENVFLDGLSLEKVK
jgi:hypothetical protein